MQEKEIQDLPYADLENLFPDYDKTRTLLFDYKNTKIEVVIRRGLSGAAIDEINLAVTSYDENGRFHLDQKKFKRLLWGKLVVQTNPVIPIANLSQLDSQLYNKMLNEVQNAFTNARSLEDTEEKMVKN